MLLYLNANTDQIYSALTNNSITSFANTVENLRHRTLSFMSDNFIFLSKTIFPEEYRCFNTEDVFYPVTVEVDFSEIENVPGYIVTKDGDKVIIAENISNIKEKSGDMIGAFVCGEIPFTFITSIIFENEENMIRFRKPSSDLWFPEELYKIVENSAEEPMLSINDIVEFSKKADEQISEEDKLKIASVVNKRNRYKGLCYFAIRETQNWVTDNFKSNIDSYIIDVLDQRQGEKGVMYNALNEKLLKLREEGYELPELAEIKEKDEILLRLNFGKTIDDKILEVVIKMFYNFENGKTAISKESVDTIKKLVLENTDFKDDNKIFDIIGSFLFSSDMNPQNALDKLEGHSVGKALMKFLDSSDNDGFMKYGCEDLNQYERRYAYMMFGALKGMMYVDKELKSNVALEHRLEEIALKKFKSNMIISSVPPKKFKNTTYGIDIECSYQMDKKTSLDILLDSGNIDKVKEVYKLAVADKNLKVKGLECFEKPCVVMMRCGDFKIEKEFKTLEELKKFIKNAKTITEFSKNVPMVIQYDLFLKNYVLDDKWYSRFFDKYCLAIQNICRR